MDWNLLNRNAHRPLLRRELVFKDVWWVYYAAAVLDFILRFAWILVCGVPNHTIEWSLTDSAQQYVFRADNFSTPLRGFVVSSLEVLRRVLWNFFRIESEHTVSLQRSLK